MDGPREIYVTIIRTATAGAGPVIDARLASLAGVAFMGDRAIGDVVAAQAHAVPDALAKAGRPVRTLDAVVLGRLLVNVLRDGQQERALDGYSSLRRPAAVEVLALAGRPTGMAATKSAPRRVIRNALLGTLDRLAPAKSRLIMNLSGLSRRRFAELA